MYKLIRKVFFIVPVIFSVFIGKNCYAGIEPYSNFTTSGRIQNNDTISVRDEKFKNFRYNWNSISNISVKNAVSLRIVDNDLVTFQFTCDAQVKIYYFTNISQTIPDSIIRTLHVNYNPNAGTTYKAIDVYDFSDLPNFHGAYQVMLKVMSITNNLNISPSAMPKILQLGCSIVIDRQYNFQPSAAISPNGSIVSNQGSGATAATNQLFLQWPPIQGAEEYDVEWTAVDKGSEYAPIINQMRSDTSTYNNNADPAKMDSIFRNNASRITTPGNECKLSLLYNEDYLLVRIRQVKDTTGGIRLTGNWDYKLASAQSNGSIYNFWYLKWNEPNLNWQYSVAFAEEGKKRETVNYFDGTLHSRQTVTMNNADSVGLAQENIYDRFGRSAASILPAPFKESSGIKPYLHYVQNFNLNASGNPYDFSNVQGTLSTPACDITPDPLSTNSGASKYYSSQNSFINDRPYNKYIPDAGGYPFAVTQYTADNTGRVKIQGGLGTIFQPRYGTSYTAGKATRYYYGKPEQWELDQLFGNDVGYAEHYFKNMVIDPNGQISVNYVNASGKTIATALTGPAPANLDTLTSYSSQTKTQNIAILTPGQFTYDATALKLTAATTYLASVTDNNAVLKYNMQKLVDNYPGGNFHICSNCYYELTIKVKDDCNNDAITPITQPVKIGSDTANCNATGIYTDSLQVNISQIGEYHITFEFAFNNTVIDRYTDSLISKGQAQGFISTQFNYIKNKYLNSIDVSGCYSDCTTCKVLLGTDSVFRKTLIKQFIALNVDSNSVKSIQFTNWADSLYTKLKNHCDSIQGTCDMAPCNAAQSLMEQDISPGGQFALFDANSTALEPEVNVLSLHWQDVFGPNHLPATLSSTDSVALDDGTFVTPYASGFSLPMLVKYWKPEWAGKFLQYHPEYCKLLFCDSMSVYENWDARVQAFINTAADIPTIKNASGVAANLQYSSTNSDWLLGTDPFFQTGKPGHAYITQMQADLNYYSVNVLKVTNSNAQTIGLSQYVTFLLYGGTSYTPANWNSCAPATGCQVIDREWLSYRDFYFALKDKYYNLLRNAQCGNTCPVGTSYTNIPLPNGCPTTTDFVISAYNGSSSCGAGTKAVRISYGAGALTQSVTVTLYYPTGANTTGLPTSVTLSQTSPDYIFCIPVSLPVSDIHIQAVHCNSTGTTNNNGYSANSGIVRIWNAGGIYYDQVYCGGSTFINTLGATYIELQDNLGNQITATNDINVTINYYNNVCGGAFTSSQTFTILAGTSISDTFYYVSDTEVECNGNCINENIYLECVAGISGGSLDPAWASYFCAGFSNPPPVSCNAALAYKDSRFPDASDGSQAMTGAQAGQASSANLTALTGQVADACAGNADTWMARLKPGTDALGATSAQLATLRSKFIEICTAGGDVNHPFGVSDIAGDASPANSSTYTSFGAAIKGELLNNGNFTPLLNPWLIDSPYPYAPQQQSAAKTVSQTDASICTLLNQYKTTYTNTLSNANLYTDQGFYNYLVATYGAAMNISLTDLSALLKSCNVCNYVLPESITLPVFMDPGAQGCVTQAMFQTALTDMNNQFGGNLSSTNANYPTILANFMNQRWGFSLGYSDYSNYISSNSTALLCNTTPYTNVNSDPYACMKSIMEIAVENGVRAYNDYITDQRLKFRTDYINTCSAAQASANLVTQTQTYHYTLYYYDQADNLMRTVPPEGVRLLTNSQMQMVNNYRVSGPPNCAYNGPAINSDVNTALNALSSAFATTTNQAVEMWLYGPEGAFMGLTPDKHFIFQVYVKGSKMAVEIFPTVYSGSTPGSIKMVSNSVHYTVDLSSLMPLKPWMHIVLQSAGFTTPGATAIYVNGIPATITSDRGFHAKWSIASGNSAVTFSQQDMSTLKHLRFYNRFLSSTEIAANANDNCFLITPSAVSANTAWYRFNVPSPGDVTTIASNSTVESQVNPIYPAHGLRTTIAYNSTNNIVLQNSPDGGTTQYWYDLLSRPNITQNDKQLAGSNYSYTTYDGFGRMIEVGQKNTVTNIKGTNYTDSIYLANSTINTFNSSGLNTQITHTYYDSSAPVVGSFTNGIAAIPNQTNFRKRIAANTYAEIQGGPVRQASYYSYDMMGNIKTLWQQISGLSNPADTNTLKRMDYEYDLISGKVNFVSYQKERPDQFYYKYEYDAENNLIDAWSGVAAILNPFEGSYILPEYKRQNVHYNYYLHGTLAREEYGDQFGKVQGFDYTYTLQGWTKGVNGNTLSNDMGNDGVPINGVAKTIPVDAYAYSLGYFQNDYAPIGGTNAPAFSMQYQSQAGDITGQSLYNSNISNSTLAISSINSGAPVGYSYRYDQLNMLKTVRHHNIGGNGTWNSNTIIQDYAESFTYDGNGNILTSVKNGTTVGGTQLGMDNLSYKYNRDSNGKLINNQLLQVNDAVPNGNYSSDIDNQPNGNYAYDQIGNLTKDSLANIKNVNWNVYGKVDTVTKSDNSKIVYSYDPSGQRVSKTVSGLSTYYIKDTKGNTLAIYDNANNTINWREQHLYGSKRLGMWKPNVNLTNHNAIAVYDTIGNTYYEGLNQSGSVSIVFKDRRLQIANGNNIGYYTADVFSASSFYAFGSLQPGRQSGSFGRNGFNGQERSTEIDVNGNHNTAEFWEYDARIGRRWNKDPKPSAYLSAYAALVNSPFWKIDFKGDTPTVHESFQMDDDSYRPYDQRWPIDGGWIRLKSLRGVAPFDVETTNYHAALYYRTVGGKTEYTYATAGTHDLNLLDWVNNIIQPLGLAPQYDYSITQAKAIVKSLPGKEVTFSGHSLGGGKAALNAIATGRYAITFNAAGLGDATKLRYHLLFNKVNILAFIVPGEEVDILQRKFGLKADGNIRYIDANWGEISPIAASLMKKLPLAPSARIKLHLMPAISDALEKSGYGSPYPEAKDPNEINSWDDVMRGLNRIIHWGQ